MLWMCLLYKLTRKVFWFQPNITLFFAHQKIWQDCGLLWDCRCSAVPSLIHSPEGIKGEGLNLGDGSAQGSRHIPFGKSQLLCVPARLCLRVALQERRFQVLFSGEDAEGLWLL